MWSILLRRGLVAEPYKIGMPGRLMTIARNCTTEGAHRRDGRACERPSLGRWVRPTT